MATCLCLFIAIRSSYCSIFKLSTYRTFGSVFVHPNKWIKRSFYWVVFIEFLICAMIHGGEINAYPEWNKKLTTRVFTHLLNPDEVVRTADYSMTIWFVIYASIEVFLSYKLMRMMFKFKETTQPFSWLIRLPIALVTLAVSGAIFVIIGRGGTQQIGRAHV